MIEFPVTGHGIETLFTSLLMPAFCVLHAHFQTAALYKSRCWRGIGSRFFFERNLFNDTGEASLSSARRWELFFLTRTCSSRLRIFRSALESSKRAKTKGKSCIPVDFNSPSLLQFVCECLSSAVLSLRWIGGGYLSLSFRFFFCCWCSSASLQVSFLFSFSSFSFGEFIRWCSPHDLTGEKRELFYASDMHVSPLTTIESVEKASNPFIHRYIDKDGGTCGIAFTFMTAAALGFSFLISFGGVLQLVQKEEQEALPVVELKLPSLFSDSFSPF